MTPGPEIVGDPALAHSPVATRPYKWLDHSMSANSSLSFVAMIRYVSDNYSVSGSTYTSVTRDAYLALKGNEVCMRVFMFGIQHYWLEGQSCERLTKVPRSCSKRGFRGKVRIHMWGLGSSSTHDIYCGRSQKNDSHRPPAPDSRGCLD